MAAQQIHTSHPQRRPFCNRCSKPLRLCLCSRLKSPPLNNNIGITILQHSLEKDHPLNSTRVARIGFKNLDIVPVTDVIFTAQFIVRPMNWPERFDFEQPHLGLNGVSDVSLLNKDEDSVDKSWDGNSDFDQTPLVKNGTSHCKADNFDIVKKINCNKVTGRLDFDKYQVVCSTNELRIMIGRTAKPDISYILETPLGKNFTISGFTVKKLQKKELPSSKELIEFEEFDITIPPGSVLLFPSANSVSLDEVKFAVKHLIVLDGTWAKAQRMYHENSWLKLLPHIKLSSVKESLYSEVRQQPKTGCLSTIESIVYTLKGLGRDMDNSDELLDVFGSMIGDQRRMKDENLMKKVAP